MGLHTDADGFVTGYAVGQRAYPTLKHPPLSYSLAKSVLICPEDAWRLTQRPELAERETSDAMDDGSILDSLLTAGEPWQPESNAVQLWTADTKKPTDPVEYSDWNGLRVIYADTLQTTAAKQAAKDARANQLTPVLLHKLTREIRKAEETLIRMELAGLDRSKYMFQVNLLWTEHARNGMRVQCRGRLDYLSHDWTSIVDLKRVEDLSERSLQSAVDRYRWAMQAAAYSRAVYMLMDFGDVPRWEWLFARTSPVVACTLRPIDAQLLEAGEYAWTRAVNEWAEGLETGLWRGHESNHLPIEPTAWAIEQMEVDNV